MLLNDISKRSQFEEIQFLTEEQKRQKATENLKSQHFQLIQKDKIEKTACLQLNQTDLDNIINRHSETYIKMQNKTSKQPATSPSSPNPTMNHLHLPMSTITAASLAGSENKAKLCTKMHKSMKPKILLTEPKQPKSQQNIIDKIENASKIKVYSNESMSKSKKMSDSYYYTNSRHSKNSHKNINTQQETNTSKYKEKQQLQLKARSHHRLLANKTSKSKMFANSNTNHKTEKTKIQNELKNYHATSNHNSLKRLISSLSNSQHRNTKLQTVRTFSPQVEFISEQLSHRRKDKKIMRKQEQVLQRMEKILEQYRYLVLKEQREKQILVKQNRKLKEKLHIINSQKKYKAVVEYNM